MEELYMEKPITKGELFQFQERIETTITYYEKEIIRLEALVKTLQEDRQNLQKQLNKALHLEPGVGYANQEVE
jgi:uncharacterized protein involved in exopolysaccharide biosynthesis